MGFEEEDRDAAIEQKILEGQIAARAKAPLEAQPTGKCLSCFKRVRKGFRWCDAECRDDWQFRIKKQGDK